MKAVASLGVGSAVALAAFSAGAEDRPLASSPAALLAKRPSASTQTFAQASPAHRVIVSLKDLGAGPASASQIAQARARVMGALQGHRVVVNREYDLIPALALTVDDEALRILQGHPDVASVVEDGTSTPGGGASSNGVGK